MEMFKKLMLLSLILNLAGCRSYSSSFSCPDARGLDCMSVSMVNQRIDSGEIEEVELAVDNNRCKGANCKNKAYRANQDKPVEAVDQTYSASLKNNLLEERDGEDESVVKVGDRIFVK